MTAYSVARDQISARPIIGAPTLPECFERIGVVVDLGQPTHEALWRAANPTNLPELGGQAVVPFFLKSKVDKGILKQIWTFSCGQSLSMQQDQFYTALRFIVMVQNGELPVTKGNNLKYLFTFGKKNIHICLAGLIFFNTSHRLFYLSPFYFPLFLPSN